MKLPVINETTCDRCVATLQMRESSHCTKKIVNHNSSFAPECFVNTTNISQAERNFLMCPTYNLGMFFVCQTCPLDCQMNPNKLKSPFTDIINLLGGFLGIDDSKKKEVDNAFAKLNQPEFKDVYSSLERASNSIKDVMNGKLGSSDVAKKILESETNNLKKSFNDLIKTGKITEAEADTINREISSVANIEKLKSVVEVMKRKV